jgi:hypothetical protein
LLIEIDCRRKLSFFIKEDKKRTPKQVYHSENKSDIPKNGQFLTIKHEES